MLKICLKKFKPITNSFNNSNVGIINCAISKELLKKKTGVTEYLSLKSNIKTNEEAMLIRN